MRRIKIMALAFLLAYPVSVFAVGGQAEDQAPKAMVLSNTESSFVVSHMVGRIPPPREIQEVTADHPPRTITLYASHFAVGMSATRGIQMEMQIVNRSANPRTYEIYTADDAGNNMGVKYTNPVNGAQALGSYGAGYLPGKSSVLKVITWCDDPYCTGPALQKGWMRFDIPQSWDVDKGEYVDDIMILLVYQITDSEGSVISTEGVSPTPARKNFLIPAAIWPNREFALAIANPWNSTKKVWLKLYEEDQLVAEKELQLLPGEQISKFLREFFPDLPKNSRGNMINQGSLEIQMEKEGAIVVLKIDSDGVSFNMAGVPPFPGRTE